MVRALSVKVTPLFTDSTCTLLLPSRVTFCPLPSRVRFWLIPSVEPRVIVPLQPNLMMSPLAALLMALRRVASSQVLTMRVTAGWAWAVRLVSPRLASTPTPSSRSSPTRRAQDERWMVWCWFMMDGPFCVRVRPPGKQTDGLLPGCEPAGTPGLLVAVSLDDYSLVCLLRWWKE